MPDALGQQLEEAAKSRGMTVSAYVREALRNYMDEATRDERLAALEDRFVASLGRMSRELRNARQDTQMVLAMFSTFVRLYLLHTPPIPREAVSAAAVAADDRYEKWMQAFLADLQGADGGVIERISAIFAEAGSGVR